jgi:DNA-binding response OmpR family regulator
MWKALQSLFTRPETGGPITPARTASQAPLIAMLEDERDRALLTEIAVRKQFHVEFAGSSVEAGSIAGRFEAPVILCDRDCPGRDWREVVRMLASVRPRPAIVLVSKVVDEFLWQEVVRHGGYDVLLKPLREEEVLRCLKLACAYRNMNARRNL